jgi:hypothetical protein
MIDVLVVEDGRGLSCTEPKLNLEAEAKIDPLMQTEIR